MEMLIRKILIKALESDNTSILDWWKYSLRYLLIIIKQAFNTNKQISTRDIFITPPTVEITMRRAASRSESRKKAHPSDA